MSIKKACEICGGNDFSLIATKIREGGGRILRCGGCGLIIQDLGWNARRLDRYYRGEYQKTNSLVTGTLQSPEEHFRDRLSTIRPIFEGIRHLLTPESRVLEVGCGAGSLLYLIKPHVRQCVGVELYKPFTNFINNDLGIEAHAEDMHKIRFKGSFDLVISIATIDHLPNPYKTLMSMKKVLSKSGRVYIEVPSCEQALNLYLPSRKKEAFNRFFWHRAHLFYFDRKTVKALFEKAAFAVKIGCRHDYTLKNFLNWYFTGKPQSTMFHGMSETGLFRGGSEFEKRMNLMFAAADKEFRKITSETFRGESLCCTGRPEGKRGRRS